VESSAPGCDNCDNCELQKIYGVCAGSGSVRAMIELG
jgi:hypothetical protein